MFCKNCGKELSENAFICPDCGEPTTHVSNEPTNSLQSATVTKTNKFDGIACIGFTCSLISVICWICYLSVVLCGYRYLTAMAPVLGIVTGCICLAGIVSSAYALTKISNSKDRAFAIAGITLSATFFVGFLLLTCIVGCL